MHSLTVTETKDVIRHAADRLNRPVMVWGGPGVGKSAGVRQLAEETDAILVDVRLSQYDAVDLRGIPVPHEVTGLTKWYAPSTLPFVGSEFPTDRRIFLFLDEINSAMAGTSAVAYQLVHDKRVGEHPLLPNVRIVAAGNRETDRGVTNRMPLPLANRFTHIETVVDVNSWCTDFAQPNNLPPVGIAFLQFRKQLLNTFDPASPHKAFATPRSWETALRYYADSMIPEHIKMACIAGTIGDGPSAEFYTFVDVWQNMIPLHKIIADPTGVEVPKEASMQYAMAVNISGNLKVASPTNTKAETTRIDKERAAMYTYLERMEPELTVLAMQLAVKREQMILTVPEFIAFSKKYKVVWT